jgi:tetratricopeptide (TPR) repeat protein
MQADRWDEVKRIANACLTLPSEQRASSVHGLCGEDADLAAEVESLIRSYAEMGRFLETPALDADSEEHLSGRQIGPYELCEQIAEGGMGTVYRAVRLNDFGKQVAIKLVKRGMDTGHILKRFRQERQILAGLDHPNIAQLLDGGATSDGRPYLVMEYIEGSRITEYVEKHRLNTRERLELFRQVCSGVQYAHQNLVVHRDLKPSNILVTENGTPKLLDFGIARILEGEAEVTATGFRAMTPEYASPEQLLGKPVTTVADVYSLGVLLYQILTSQRPYKFEVRSPEEIARIVCETDPPKLRPLGQDLDQVVLQAMHKDPARRYASAAHLSEDIRRYLVGLPVVAHKDTFAYRASKFVARHRAATAAALLVAFSLIIGVAATSWEAHRANMERARAERHFNEVRRLANSLIFDVHDSIRDLPGSTPARKIIVQRALEYLNRLSPESSGDLALQRELATAYIRVGEVEGQYLAPSLGDTKGSLQSYQKALQLRQEIASTSADWRDRLEVAKAYRLVAIQDFANGDGSRARHDIEAAILLAEKLSKDRPDEWAIASEAATEHQWSTVIGYNGVADEEERIAEDRRRAVRVDEVLLRLRPNDAATLHRYALNLGYLAAQLGRSDPTLALTYGQKVLQIEMKLQQESPKTRLVGGLAFAYSVLVDLFFKDIHDYASARSYAERQLLDGQQAVRLDPRNHMLQRILAAQYLYLAEVDSKTGRLSQSLEGIKKGQAIARALIEADPENVPNRGVLADNLSFTGQVLLLARKPKDAFGQLDEARALYEPFPKTDSKATVSSKAAICLVKMGEAAGQMGKPVLAETYFRRTLGCVEPRVAQSTDREALFTAAAAYAGLGNIEVRRAQRLMASEERGRDSWVAAEAWYRKSLAAWKRIDFPNRETPLDLDFGEPAAVAKNLERCESALSSIR